MLIAGRHDRFERIPAAPQCVLDCRREDHRVVIDTERRLKRRACSKFVSPRYGPVELAEVEGDQRVGTRLLKGAGLLRCNNEVDVQSASRLHERGGSVRGGRQQQEETRRATSW